MKKNVDMLKAVVDIRLGSVNKTVGGINNFERGTIIILEKYAGEPVDIFANNTQIASGEIVLINDKYGARIIDIMDSEKDQMNEK